MASLLIRNVDPALHAILKARAAEHGCTLEGSSGADPDRRQGL
jgi:plasmid stability protein